MLQSAAGGPARVVHIRSNLLLFHLSCSAACDGQAPGRVFVRDLSRSLVRQALFVVAMALAPAGCGTNPTTPTPPGPPTLTCPEDIEATAENGIAAVISFNLPPVQGGQPPLSLTCHPSSGFPFPVGDSTVTCTVTDASQRSASCRFRVRVVPAAGLSRTRFLAFGDSITEGKIAPAWNLLSMVGPGFSYPAQLRDILSARYPSQEIVVINEGVGGDTTNDGRERLPGTLAAHASDVDVMLLLMGVNAINVIPRSTQIANLRFMIRAAQDAGLDVLIATLTPISDERAARSPSTPGLILDLNEGIRQLAAQEGIAPAVDLFEAFEGRPELLSADGLHPSEEGYRVIALTFADEITRRWETGRSPSTVTRVGASRRR
ncbi:MAG TPA: GDSL-type esterase/lipase family protein [Vicinamibacterales bacterium]|nr:GDSL-type esterase/lipase family protein [Vicinamibacterales bacterium]